MTNNNAHQLPALIKVSSFMQPQRFSLQSAQARSLGSAACLVLSGKVRDPRFLRRWRQKVSESITSPACRARRQRGLRPSALTEVLRSPRLVEQSRAHLGFGDSRLRKPSPWRTDTLYATVKTTKDTNFQVSTTKNNRINQETPNHEVHAHVNSQVDCTQGCTRVPEGLRFNELLSSGGRRGRLDCFRPGSIRGCFQCQTSGNNT